MRRKRTQGEVNLFTTVYPVTSAIAYGNGCYRVIRTAKSKLRGRPPERGTIMELSKKSLLLLMFIMQCTQTDFGLMLTLTYPKIFPRNGRLVKSDVNVMTQKIRRFGWSYLWFLEFQQRGAPHVHILIGQNNLSPRMRVNFGLFWTSRIANSDWFVEACPEEDYTREVLKMARVNCHEKTMAIIKKSDGAKRYVTKYASKEKSKTVPKAFRDVGRFWGASRDVYPQGIQFDVSEEEMEKWLVEHDHPATAYDMIPKYIWGVDSSYADADKVAHTDDTRLLTERA